MFTVQGLSRVFSFLVNAYQLCRSQVCHDIVIEIGRDRKDFKKKPAGD